MKTSYYLTGAFFLLMGLFFCYCAVIVSYPETVSYLLAAPFSFLFGMLFILTGKRWPKPKLQLRVGATVKGVLNDRPFEGVIIKIQTRGNVLFYVINGKIEVTRHSFTKANDKYWMISNSFKVLMKNIISN